MSNRVLKRPMFRRGGMANQGIMTGLEDRSGYQEGGDVNRMDNQTFFEDILDIPPAPIGEMTREEAKDYLRDQKYWDIEDLIWTPGSQQHYDASEYLKLPSRYRDAMRANDPYYQQIQREVERKRIEMVSQNQELDRILVTYYGNNPRHPLNTGLKQRLMQENATRPSRTPDPTAFTVSETGRIQISPIEL